MPGPPLGESLRALLAKYELPLDEFLHHLSHSPSGTSQSDLAALQDLALALASARGNRLAIDDFEREMGPDFDAIAAKLKLQHSTRRDARQRLWLRLLVGEDGTAKILEYGGRGRLRNWFRVVASRFLLNELRRDKRDRLLLDPEHAELGIDPGRDPELMLLKRTYSRYFRSAFQKAVSSLRPEQRNALRNTYLYAMTIDQLAEVYGVHRATAARRVVSAREELLRLVCENLREALGSDSDELSSIMRNAQEQSSLSVARLLDQSEAT